MMGLHCNSLPKRGDWGCVHKDTRILNIFKHELLKLIGEIVLTNDYTHWHRTVKDFEDWTNWLFHKGGIGDQGKNSWEVWWKEEIAHIQTTRGRFWEIVLSTRFFIFQYGVVYALNAAGNDRSFRVSKYSEMVMLFIHLYLFTDTRIIIAALIIDKYHSTYAHTKATLKSLRGQCTTYLHHFQESSPNL